MTQVWVGVDGGRQAHHAAAVDAARGVLWSTPVANEQGAIAALICRVDPDDEVVWAVDLVGWETALLRAMLAGPGHKVVDVPGWTVNTMAGGFTGEAKTDLLTELADRSLGWCVPGGSALARFAARDQRRGCTAELVPAGGAAGRVA